MVLQDYDEDIDAMMDNILTSERDQLGQLGADSRFSCTFLGLFMMFLSATFFQVDDNSYFLFGKELRGEVSGYAARADSRVNVFAAYVVYTAFWESFNRRIKELETFVARSCVGGGMLGGWFLISQIPFSDAKSLFFLHPSDYGTSQGHSERVLYEAGWLRWPLVF